MIHFIANPCGMLRLELTKVHLISVKIGIVRVADALIQSERSPRPDFRLIHAYNSGTGTGEMWTYLMAHDRELMTRQRSS